MDMVRLILAEFYYGGILDQNQILGNLPNISFSYPIGGAVWCIDVDWETKNFMSGAADNTIRLWDVQTGW